MNEYYLRTQSQDQQPFLYSRPSQRAIDIYRRRTVISLIRFRPNIPSYPQVGIEEQSLSPESP